MTRMTTEQFETRIKELKAKGVDVSMFVKCDPLENNETGFSSKEKAVDFLNTEKHSWGSNLVGWVESVNGMFFVKFNIFD